MGKRGFRPIVGQSPLDVVCPLIIEVAQQFRGKSLLIGKAMMPRHIHAVSFRGFLLKISLFIIAFALSKAFI
jgi:hypothetical protein